MSQCQNELHILLGQTVIVLVFHLIFFLFFLLLLVSSFRFVCQAADVWKEEKTERAKLYVNGSDKIQWYPIVPIQFDQFVLKFVLKSCCLANRYILDLGFFFSSLSNTTSPL